jgi:hypothetical protein
MKAFRRASSDDERSPRDEGAPKCRKKHEMLSHTTQVRPNNRLWNHLTPCHVEYATVAGKGRHNTISGSSRCSFQNNAATIYTIASTGAMLLYRAETRQRRNAALAAERCCASDFNSRQHAWHSSHTLRTQFLSHTTAPRGGPCSFLPGLLVGWHHQSTTEVYSGPGSRHCHGIITLFP